MKSVLITDSLFLPIDGEDERRLRAAGFEVDRLDEPKADEATLVDRIRGKSGYILGGVESVTEAVIEAADQLEAIAFTGSGYADFIPAWELATSRGIAISAARGENAEAVADWTLANGLALVRNIPALTSSGGPSFFVSRDFASLTWGIIGMGNVGTALAIRLEALGLRVLRSPSPSSSEAGPVTLNDLLSSSDIVSVHVSRRNGTGVLDAAAIDSMPDGSILINAAFADAIDNDALLRRVAAGQLRAAVDYPLEAAGLPIGGLLASNDQTGFNTAETNARVGARAVTSLINLLESGSDPDLVNPEYRDNR